MKILYVENVKKNYYCEYYKSMVEYLTIGNELILCPPNGRKIAQTISSFKPDILILGFSITDTGGEKPSIIFNAKGIPTYLILNKEYDALDEKLSWIKTIKFKRVFTVHHDYKLFEQLTNIPFTRIMWSAEIRTFKKYNTNYQNDLYFSGVIRKEQTNNLRKKIYDKLYLLKDYKLFINVGIYDGSNPNKPRWIKKWAATKQNIYAKNLNNSKIVVTTTGPANLVGTRFFEIMATNKALIMCNRMSKKVYSDIVEDKKTCIMFKDENDFIEKFIYYIQNEDQRLKIVNNAYDNFIKRHTWNKHVEKLLKYIDNPNNIHNIKMITICLSYYNQSLNILLKHIENWKSFPNNILDQFKFCIVDDCSKIPIDQMLKDVDLSNLSIKLYRVKQDLNCNIGGVRNLAATQCSTPWMVILDMDTVIDRKVATSLVEFSRNNMNNNIAFKFNRIVPENKNHIKNNKPHPAVCLIRKEDYWNIGGCDEDFVGNYGQTDPHFWYRAKGIISVKEKNSVYLLYYPEGESNIDRNRKPNQILFDQKKKKQKEWSTDYLRFDWELIACHN